MCADGWLAMLACAPLDLPAFFSFALPHTCIWILLIVQRVSDQLAVHHVLLVVRPRFPDVF